MFVSGTRTKMFSLKANRDETRLAIEGLLRGAPFSQNERSPVEMWAGITNTAVSTLLEKLCSAMDFPDRIQERTGVDSAGAANNSDAKRAFDVAMQELRRVVFSNDKRMLACNDIYIIAKRLKEILVWFGLLHCNMELNFDF
jgi:hypothetical protein